MTRRIGVGVEGALGAKGVGKLAALAEELGYASFWFNAIGPSVDPFALLAAALEATKTIEIGVGIFPIDRFPAAMIAERHKGVNLPERVVLGLAAGQIKQGVIGAVGDAVQRLRRDLPGIRIATAGYGPKILALTGAQADIFLGNWLTPQRLGWSLEHVGTGARSAGRPTPPTYLYHRCAMGADAQERLRAEILEYRKYPVHQKHQAAMGNPDIIGVAASIAADIPRQLADYPVETQIVFKPLAHNVADVAETAALLRFFRP